METTATWVTKLLQTLRENLPLAQINEIGTELWARHNYLRSDISVFSFTNHEIVFVSRGHLFQIYPTSVSDGAQSWDIRIYTKSPEFQDGECSCIACMSAIKRRA